MSLFRVSGFVQWESIAQLCECKFVYTIQLVDV